MKWIKYPEQKPTETSKYYLIYRPDVKIVEASWYSTYSSFTFDGYDGDMEDYEDSEVSHWMDMPKGPDEMD